MRLNQETKAKISTGLAVQLLKVHARPLAIWLPSLLFLRGLSDAGVAQLVEHLICNQRVGGSIPSASSTMSSAGSEAGAIPAVKIERAGVFGHESVLCFR